jgi:WD40 repeat protein
VRQWRVGEIIDGRYQVKQIHEGGMGWVYRVRHLGWKTDLALKVPKGEHFQTERHKARFTDEAENWVNLPLHPHICACYNVRILDVPDADEPAKGVPHVFAEYISGGSLTRWIADGRLYSGDASLAPILDVAIQVAWGLAHAHNTRGLVHRDVKPDNILVADDGTARVTDFGLAAAFAAGSDLPRGCTRQFASPEQLSPPGQPSPDATLDYRTDIFGFGASVLAMVMRGASWVVGPAATFALTECDPLSRPLREVLERCLAWDIQARYPSMDDVAAALTEVYRRETKGPYPRPAPVAAELRAAELNNRALSLLDLGRTTEASEAFAQALAVDPSHLEATYNAGLAKWRAAACSDTHVLGAIDATGDDSPRARYLRAEIHLERGDLASARRLLAGLSDAPEASDAIQGALESADLPDAGCVSVTRFPWQSTRTRESSKLKIRLRADGQYAVTGSDDGPVRLWDMRTGECVHLLKGHSQGVSSVDLTPDGRFAVSSASDGAVRYWDLTDGSCLRTFTPRGPQGRISPQHVRITADGRHVLGTGRDGNVMVWGFPDGQLLRTLDGHQRDLVLDVADHPSLVLTSGNEDPRTTWGADEEIESAFTVRLWDLTTGECRKVLYMARSVTALRLSDDGRTALVGSYDQTIRLYDLENGQQLANLVGHPSGFPSTLALSQDGSLAVSGGLDRFGMPEGTPNAVRLWSLKDGRCLRAFDGHLDTVEGVAIVPGSPFAISVSGDDTVRRWRFPGHYAAPFQVSRPRPPAELVEIQSRAESLVAAARVAMRDGDHATAVAQLTEARSLRGHERVPFVRSAWRDLSGILHREGLRDAWPVRTMSGHTSAVFSVAVSGDGRIAASGGLGGQARIWDITTGECLHVLPDQPARLRTVAVTTDGAKALTACADGTLAVWSTASGGRVAGIDGRVTHGAEPASFNATGTLALVGAHDSTLRLWDLEQERLLMTLSGYATNTRIHGVWLHPDCRRAVSVAADRTVRLWELDWDRMTGECVRTMTGHSHEVMEVCGSPDGRHVLTCGGYTDTTIRRWNLETGRCDLVLPSPGVRTAQFSPDGRYAVAAGRDTAFRLWDLTTGNLLRTIDAHTQAAEAAVMTPDSCHLLSAGSDDNLRLWELDWNLSL